MSSPLPDLAALAPDLAPRFEVVELTARHPAGLTLRVRRREDGEELALELLQPTVRDPQAFAERTDAQARAAATIEHPGVARLLEHGVGAGGRIHLVREVVDGVALQRLIDAHTTTPPSPPSVALVVAVTSRLLDALGAVHDAGLVVRELSPAAVRLRRDADGSARPVLLDVGVGRGWTDEVSLNAPGVVLGALRYAAPESFDEARRLGPAADLYAVGIVLFELLTGRYPIAGETPTSLIAGHLFRPPLGFDVADPNGRVPAPLRALVECALDKEPGARWPSARAMAEALHGLPAERASEPADALASEAARWLGGAAESADGAPTRDALEVALEEGDLDAARALLEEAREAGAAWVDEMAQRLLDMARFTHRRTIRRCLDEARALLAHDEPEAAIERLDEALALVPDEPELLELREQIVQQTRRRRAERAQPPAPPSSAPTSADVAPVRTGASDVAGAAIDALLDAARGLARQEDFVTARDTVRRALALRSGHGEALALLASLDACLRIQREESEQEHDLDRTVQGIRQMLVDGRGDAAQVALEEATGRFGARPDLIDLRLDAATRRLDETATGLSTVRVAGEELPSRQELLAIAAELDAEAAPAEESTVPPSTVPPSDVTTSTGPSSTVPPSDVTTSTGPISDVSTPDGHAAEPAGTSDLGSLTIPMDRIDSAKRRALHARHVGARHVGGSPPAERSPPSSPSPSPPAPPSPPSQEPPSQAPSAPSPASGAPASSPSSSPPAPPSPPSEVEVTLSELGFGLGDDGEPELGFGGAQGTAPSAAAARQAATPRTLGWPAVVAALLLVFAVSFGVSALLGGGLLGDARSPVEWLESLRRETAAGADDTTEVEAGAASSDASARSPEETPVGPPGVLVVDAAPWGEVVSLRDAAGDEVPIAGARSTPLRLRLPPGVYALRIVHPPSGAETSVEIEVASETLITRRLELTPLTVQEYFDRVGW